MTHVELQHTGGQKHHVLPHEKLCRSHHGRAVKTDIWTRGLNRTRKPYLSKSADTLQ